MRVDILGCRGSTPAPGPEFVRYGGETSCVAVSVDGSEPQLVLDAGTGLRHLGKLLGGAAFSGSILLTHLHWDHTHGLPFTPEIDRPDAEVSLLIPGQDQPAEEILGRAMSPPHFPISPGGLNGRWEFGFVPEEEFKVGALSVTATPITHKRGRTLGFRVSDGDRSFAYMPDHAVGDGDDVELARGVDVLIHDAQYTSAEQVKRRSFGHCSIEEAVEFAVAAEVGELVLFHHHFNRSDEEIDQIVSDLDTRPFPISAASEGMTINL